MYGYPTVVGLVQCSPVPCQVRYGIIQYCTALYYRQALGESDAHIEFFVGQKKIRENTREREYYSAAVAFMFLGKTIRDSTI